jgi:hypothetical protein
MKRLKTRKNPQTHNHQNCGLAFTNQSPADTIMLMIIVDMTIDLIKSVNHNRGVEVLNPYLFSILNVV